MEPVDRHPFPPDVSFDGGDLGPERVLVTPDCGFATFADNPVASAGIAEAKLRAIVHAIERAGRG